MQLLNTDGTINAMALKAALQEGADRLEAFEAAFKKVEDIAYEDMAYSDLSVALEDAKAKLEAGHRLANALVRGVGLSFVGRGQDTSGHVIAYSTNTGNKNDPTPPDGGQ